MIIQQSIEKTLGEAFNVEYLLVENESHKHSVPPNSETHFKVTLVSSDFEGVRQVARHQKIYKALASQLAKGVHALALHTYVAAEWKGAEVVPNSPNCMGGSKAKEA